MMQCPDCGKDLDEPCDTTYSNINTKRASVGQHTGDIYECDVCDKRWIDNFLTKRIEKDFT